LKKSFLNFFGDLFPKTDFRNTKTFQSLTKEEDAGLTRVFSKEERDGGFQQFIKDPEVQQKAQAALKSRREVLQAEAENKGEEYKEEHYVAALMTVRSQLWRELTEEERGGYREKARISKAGKRDVFGDDR
jgi:hypothetical protein